MSRKMKQDIFKINRLAYGLALVMLSGGAMAAEPIPADEKVPEVEPVEVSSGALAAAKLDPNNTALMKKLGLTFGGWLQTGVTYNSTNPGNGFNGPVTFGDRSAELQLNQLYFFLQKAVATEGDSWDVGGRFDFMYGSDSIFTQAYGVPAYDVNNGQAMTRSHWDLNLLRNTSRFYDIALPQLYLEAYVPIGNGINIKAGHFYTPIGYEVVTAPDNFFYSHAYTMQYGEPFTHTGVLGSYTIDKNWSTIAGVVTGSATGGWDGGWDQQLGNWAGLLGGTWNTEDHATSFNLTGTYGGTSERSGQSWGFYSMVFKHNILSDLHMVVQHDHGFANGVLVSTGVRDAEWYGINSYLMYDITDKLGVGMRAEWFRDNAGFRVCAPGRVAAATNAAGPDNVAVSSASSTLCGNGTGFGTPSSYYAFTFGMNYKPLKWLTLRPNLRYDWADGHDPLTGDRYKPFGNGKDAQLLFSADAVIVF